MTSSAKPACCAPAAAVANPARTVQRADKVKLIQRLNRIEGQVRGVRQMLENDRYCIDVLGQVQAARQALAALAEALLDDHLQGCVARAVAAGEAEQAVAEVMQVIRKMR